MAFTDLPLFSVLRQNMSWLTSRQRVISENIANADTPGFRARDVSRPDFQAVLRQSSRGGSGSMVRTDPRHMSSSQSTSTPGGFRIEDSPDSASKPNGNTVVLEDQMMRVAETQMNHQAAVGLYQKSLGILRMAVRGAR